MRTTARERKRCVLRCSTTFPATGRRVAQALGVVLAAAWPPGAAAVKGVFEDKEALSAAVSDWIANAATAEGTHGAISGWDTSRVDDMSQLFQGKSGFNAQLNWDTSEVTNMGFTFKEAKAFNQELAWDTSKVTSMYGTFYEAEAFDQALAWDTSRVTDIGTSFKSATAFAQDLSAWDVAKVTDMADAFADSMGAATDCAKARTAASWTAQSSAASGLAPWTGLWTPGECAPFGEAFRPADRAALKAAVKQFSL